MYLIGCSFTFYSQKVVYLLLADVLPFIFLYWVILSEFFHVYSPQEIVHALLWYVQLPSWRTQPGIAKMLEVKGDGGSRAQGGQVRVRETRIHTTGLAPSPFTLDIRAWSQAGLGFLCLYLPRN